MFNVFPVDFQNKSSSSHEDILSLLFLVVWNFGTEKSQTIGRIMIVKKRTVGGWGRQEELKRIGPGLIETVKSLINTSVRKWQRKENLSVCEINLRFERI